MYTRHYVRSYTLLEYLQLVVHDLEDHLDMENSNAIDMKIAAAEDWRGFLGEFSDYDTDALCLFPQNYEGHGPEIDPYLKRALAYGSAVNCVRLPVNIIYPFCFLGDYTPLSSSSSLSFDNSALSGTDRWILHRLAHAVEEWNDAFDSCQFSRAATVCHDFWFNEFWNTYCRCIQLQIDQPNKRSVVLRHIIYTCLDFGLRLLHPFMPDAAKALLKKISPKKSLGEPSTPRSIHYPSTNDWKTLDLSDAFGFQMSYNIVQCIRTIMVKKFRDLSNDKPKILLTGEGRTLDLLKDRRFLNDVVMPLTGCESVGLAPIFVKESVIGWITSEVKAFTTRVGEEQSDLDLFNLPCSFRKIKNVGEIPERELEQESTSPFTSCQLYIRLPPGGQSNFNLKQIKRQIKDIKNSILQLQGDCEGPGTVEKLAALKKDLKNYEQKYELYKPSLYYLPLSFLRKKHPLFNLACLANKPQDIILQPGLLDLQANLEDATRAKIKEFITLSLRFLDPMRRRDERARNFWQGYIHSRLETQSKYLFGDTMGPADLVAIYIAYLLRNKVEFTSKPAGHWFKRCEDFVLCNKLKVKHFLAIVSLC